LQIPVCSQLKKPFRCIKKRKTTQYAIFLFLGLVNLWQSKIKNTDVSWSTKKSSKLATSPRTPRSDRTRAQNHSDPNETQTNDDILPPTHLMEVDDVEMGSESLLDFGEGAHRGDTPGDMVVDELVEITEPAIRESPPVPPPCTPREEADAATKALDHVEEDAEKAYKEYMMRLGCLRITQQVVTTALAAAKAVKENYKRVQISV
jgi:hypothetical protein